MGCGDPLVSVFGLHLFVSFAFAGVCLVGCRLDERFDDKVPINLPAPPGMGVLPIAPNMDGEETASSSGIAAEGANHELQQALARIAQLEAVVLAQQQQHNNQQQQLQELHQQSQVTQQ